MGDAAKAGMEVLSLGTSTTVGYVVSLSSIDMREDPPEDLQLKTLKGLSTLPAGASLHVLLRIPQVGETGCEGTVCGFLRDTLGGGAQLRVSLLVAPSPLSATLSLAIEYVTLAWSDQECRGGGPLPIVTMESLSIFATLAVGEAPTFGLEAVLAFDRNAVEGTDSGDRDRCADGAGSVITFRASISFSAATVTISIGLDGVWLRPFGADALMLGNVGGAITFGVPLINGLQIEGQLGIGQCQYVPNNVPMFVPTSSRHACLFADVAVGFSANQPSDNYVYAALGGLTLNDAIRLFAPPSVSSLLGTMPRWVLDSGFPALNQRRNPEMSFAAGEVVTPSGT